MSDRLYALRTGICRYGAPIAADCDRDGNLGQPAGAVAAAVLACAVIWLAALPAHAVDAINVRTDAPAIDLTDAAERQRTDGDRIQVSTAPGPDGIVRRIEVRAREAGNQLGGVRARQYRRRADRPADRRAALPHGRAPACSGPISDCRASSTITPSSGERPDRQDSRDRRHFPHHARSRHGHHLRARAAHRQPAAALSVGAGRLQGQDQFLHALLRHRHRHRRTCSRCSSPSCSW